MISEFAWLLFILTILCLFTSIIALWKLCQCLHNRKAKAQVQPRQPTLSTKNPREMSEINGIQINLSEQNHTSGIEDPRPVEIFERAGHKRELTS